MAYSLAFVNARNRLIREYHREVHPLWLDYQKHIEQAASIPCRNTLARQFQKKINPRLKQLFSDIAKIRSDG